MRTFVPLRSVAPALAGASERVAGASDLVPPAGDVALGAAEGAVEGLVRDAGPEPSVRGAVEGAGLAVPLPEPVDGLVGAVCA